jgi:hypothetical protein
VAQTLRLLGETLESREAARARKCYERALALHEIMDADHERSLMENKILTLDKL